MIMKHIYKRLNNNLKLLDATFEKLPLSYLTSSHFENNTFLKTNS